MSTTAAVSVVTKVVTASASAASASATSGNRANPQGGILDGINPAVYNTSNPVNTLIIQAGIIIIFCRLLHWPLSKLRQPRVISEVIGGILLGPSVFGRIPGFTDAIFPSASIPTLNAVATIGLVLFLFLVGLEADFRYVAHNWRVALSVGALGMVIPFGLGIAIAYGLYNEFKNEPGTVQISFGIYLLFVGVAMAITAFPVLCRILTELKLLRTPVGIIVLSAGVGNDVCGWVLLALCVALVNAGSGLTALWIILIAIGYVLFVLFAVRPAFMWVLRKTDSIKNGPSQSVIALTVLMILASSFFTGIIGIHPMFGGFLIGLICPHEGGFAIKITEKIEDLVSTMLLPLYFALSGLSTNLGLLNNGITWAYVIGIICVAFFGKLAGGTLAARANGLVWRESLTIGSLMSCKGLVELIVLNIGLQAKILSPRTFTMFVVMALIITFATTPLVSWLYPYWYQVKLEAWKRGEIDWDTGDKIDPSERSSFDGILSKSDKPEISKILAYLRFDSLPGVLTLVSLLAKPVAVIERSHPSANAGEKVQGTDDLVRSSERALRLHGVRLTAVGDRDSSVMRVTELDEYSDRDPVINTITALGQVRNLSVSGAAILTPPDFFAQSLQERATDIGAELMLLPWSESGALSEQPSDIITTPRERFGNSSFSSFVANAMTSAICPIAVLVDNGFGTRKRGPRPALSRTVSALSHREMNLPSYSPSLNQGHHVFLPYFGSPDDKLALRLVLQLAAASASVTATIIHFELPESEIQPAPGVPTSSTKVKSAAATAQAEVSYDLSGDIRRDSDAANAEGKVAAVSTRPIGASQASYSAFFAALRDSLPADLAGRVVFEVVSAPSPTPSSSPAESTAAAAAARVAEEMKKTPKNAGDLVVLGRNAHLATALRAVGPSGSGVEPPHHPASNNSVMESEARKALGEMADCVTVEGVTASLLVVQAGGEGV